MEKGGKPSFLSIAGGPQGTHTCQLIYGFWLEIIKSKKTLFSNLDKHVATPIQRGTTNYIMTSILVKEKGLIGKKRDFFHSFFGRPILFWFLEEKM